MSAKIQRTALRTCIALYSSELIHRNRRRKGQSGPVLRVVRHTRSVKKRPPRGQIPFSTLSSPPSHPPAMRGLPIPLISESDPRGANSREERRDEYGYKWEDSADATPKRRPAMKDVRALNEKYRRRLPGEMSKRALKRALSSKRSIPHPRYRTLTLHSFVL